MSFDRIVIAVDFTVDSTTAVTWIARRFAPDAELLLVHAVDVPDASSLRGERQAEVDARRETLRVGASVRVDGMVELLGGHHARALVGSGSAADVILEATRAWRGQLLVLGRHGERPGLWNTLGGTVDDLLGRADVPLLVVSGTPDAAPRHVLVAAEGGISDDVGRCVRTLYDLFAPRITVFHSVSVAVPTYLLALSASREGHATGDAAYDSARGDAERWAESLTEYGIPRSVIDSEATLGEAGAEIVAAGDRLQVDLIIVDRPRKGDFRRAMLGSVTSEVVRHARRPVLIVQHPHTRNIPDGLAATSPPT